MTRWTYLKGLDGRVGLRVLAARRKHGKLKLVGRILVPAVAPNPHRAFRMALVAKQDGEMPEVTMPELMRAAKQKGAFPWT